MEAFRDEEAARISESIIAAEFEPITEPEIVVVNLHSHNFVTVDSMQALTMANSETELSIVRQEISTAHPASSTTTFGEPVSTNHQQTADLIASPTKSHTIVASSQAQMGSSTSSSFPTVSVSSVLESSLSMTTNLQTGLQDATLLDSATQNTSLISKSTANKPVPSPNTVSISHSRPHLQPHQPLTSGESIYGAITKRLNSLEREVILTLRYVEEQGRIFQDIFARLESKLVETEVTRLKNEQNLRRLSLEMDFHRARVEEERIAMANQVNVLAEEVYSFCVFVTCCRPEFVPNVDSVRQASQCSSVNRSSRHPCTCGCYSRSYCSLCWTALYIWQKIVVVWVIESRSLEDEHVSFYSAF